MTSTASPYPPTHTATRTAALHRLAAFVPKAGRAYASMRNHDVPGHPHVSGLSPYLKHRIITEAEVLEAILARHSRDAAAKSVDEVFWRTYWKGWLELRPGVWRDYRQSLQAAFNRVQTESGLHREWEAACLGQTGIAPFDHWAQELVATGYMHNHARMWFASIWIFTLRLPWELGADFFLRHLLDGDPASNTLSWRWVAGIQTKGKTYLARPDNIARYTEGRFDAAVLRGQLAGHAEAVTGPPVPPPTAAPQGDHWQAGGATGLLLTEEDLSPHWLFAQGVQPQATATFLATQARSPLAVSALVSQFAADAMDDVVARWHDRLGPVMAVADVPAIVGWARELGLSSVVTSYVPTGPTMDALRDLRGDLAKHDIALSMALRPFDSYAWPRATHGFFKFRDAIPQLLDSM